MTMMVKRLQHLSAVLVAMLAAGCAASVRPPAIDASGPRLRYVAMGSSFAAGPGITSSADEPRNRCSRSTDNYAHILARRRNLDLVDVSCSGATTAHVLGRWAELPPQMDALAPDTGLVTITIGGNDVGYVGGLISASCKLVGLPPQAPFAKCPDQVPVSEEAWDELARQIIQIGREIRNRAPQARVVVVDYLELLPAGRLCPATPLPDAQLRESRAIAAKLAKTTARAARSAGMEMLRASSLSRKHDACSLSPWTTGYPRQINGAIKMPYHPNAAGMFAVAQALDRKIFR